ncbi:MAG: amidohydrolase, partial [Acidobacteriota bacterium]
GGVRDFEAKLEMDDEGAVTGELISDAGTTEIEDGRMSGDRLSFGSQRTMGPRTFTVSYSMEVDGESLDGSASAGPMVMDITGERTEKAAPSDDGDDEGSEDDADVVTLDELRAAMATYRGPAREMGSFAIIDATVYTVTGDVIEGGTVVVEDGKITAVGADVQVPTGVDVIDADGLSLIPGIIDAHSHIAVDGAVNEGSLAVTSMVTIADVVDPHDIGIYRALAGGVTSINILHGSANPIGGGNAVIKLRWGQDADGMSFEGAPKGIKFALGENPKRSRSVGTPGPRRYPATRMGVMDVIRQAFTEAIAYRQDWRDYDAAKARGESPMPPRRDRKYDALVEILDGERLVHSHCYRADEILQLLRLAEEFGFKISTLQHVLEGYKVADEIAAHGAGGSTFSDWWGFKVEAYEAIHHHAALGHQRRVVGDGFVGFDLEAPPVRERGAAGAVGGDLVGHFVAF